METEEAAESQRNKATPPSSPPSGKLCEVATCQFSKARRSAGRFPGVKLLERQREKKKKQAFESFSSFSGARLNSAVMSVNCVHATRKVKRLRKETQT